jgi:hypothetical protein
MLRTDRQEMVNLPKVELGQQRAESILHKALSAVGIERREVEIGERSDRFKRILII